MAACCAAGRLLAGILRRPRIVRSYTAVPRKYYFLRSPERSGNIIGNPRGDPECLKKMLRDLRHLMDACKTQSSVQDLVYMRRYLLCHEDLQLKDATDINARFLKYEYNQTCIKVGNFDLANETLESIQRLGHAFLATCIPGLQKLLSERKRQRSDRKIQQT
eukprot:1356958-Amorphochlora_amoeboformis.AAC.2